MVRIFDTNRLSPQVRENSEEKYIPQSEIIMEVSPETEFGSTEPHLKKAEPEPINYVEQIKKNQNELDQLFFKV